MGKYVKKFDGIASAIITNCIVFTPDDLSKVAPRAYYHSENCAWDTGSEVTIVCPELAEALKLEEIGKGEVSGLGVTRESSVVKLHLGLPSGETFEDVEAFVDELPDYDLLIGMDVMREMDVAITHSGGRTKFTYERPSKRDIDFTKE